MDMVLAQFGIGTDPAFSWIIWIIFMVVFFMFYPRIMLSQIMWKLERVVRDLEAMSNDSKKFITREISKKPSKPLRDSVNRFFEFFMITPVSLDPYGVMKKVEHLVQGQKERFDYFVDQVAPRMEEEKKANIQMGLAGGITLYELSKIVRHYVEIVKKTKSFQIAMILQMQLPLIETIAKSVYKGTKTLAKGRPIGDALGPYVIAHLIGNEKFKVIEEDIIMTERRMHGRRVYLLKARGPGGRLGRPGKAVDKLVNSHKISKIISVDAAAKLEGEKTGSIAEGIGVAMGGIGVERSYIENIAVKNKIPLDSVIVKMSQEEAIQPLKKVIISALPGVKESIKRSIEATSSGSSIIIVGVGNTSGVGNSIKSLEKTVEWVEKYEKENKSKKKKKN
jgi:hypothetical protein